MAGTRGDVAFTTTCLSCGWKCFLVEELGAISLSSFVFPWRGHGARVPSPCPIEVFFRCWGRAGLQGAGGDGSVSRSPSPQALFLRLFGLDHSIWIRFFWFCLHCLWRCFPKQHRGGSLGAEKGKKRQKKKHVLWVSDGKTGGKAGGEERGGTREGKACEHRPSCAPAAPLPPRHPRPHGMGLSVPLWVALGAGGQTGALLSCP